MKNGLSLRFKISIMIILILAFALLLNMLLNFFNFEKNYTNIVYSRFFVVAKDLQNTAEYGLSLGLLLPELKNLQEVINGIADERKDIVSIIIFDDGGQVVFHTNPEGDVGEGLTPFPAREVPSKWLEGPKEMDKEAISKLAHDDTFVIVLPLVNTFNIKVGALALSFSKSHIGTPVKRMLLYLFKWFSIFLVMFAAITFAGISLFSRGIIKNLYRMQSSLEDFLRGRPGDFEGLEPVTDVQEELIAFQEKSMEVLQKIDEASKELKQIDDGGLQSEE